MTPFTVEDVHAAGISQTGRLFATLRRLQIAEGDSAIRLVAIDLLRSVSFRHHHHPSELLNALSNAVHEPESAKRSLRVWLAADAAMDREAAKLFLDWGGSLRVGQDLLGQVSRVCYFHMDPENATACLSFLSARLLQ